MRNRMRRACIEAVWEEGSVATRTLPSPCCQGVPPIFWAFPPLVHSPGHTVETVCLSPLLDSELLEGRDVSCRSFMCPLSILHGTEALGTDLLTRKELWHCAPGSSLVLPHPCSSWLMTRSWSWGTGSTPSARRTTSLVPCRSTRTSSTSSPLCCSWWGVAIKEYPQFHSTLGSHFSRGLGPVMGVWVSDFFLPLK